MVTLGHGRSIGGRAQNEWVGQTKPGARRAVQAVRRDAIRPECVRLPKSTESSIRFGTTKFRPPLQNLASRPLESDISTPDNDRRCDSSSSCCVGDAAPIAPATLKAIDHSRTLGRCNVNLVRHRPDPSGIVSQPALRLEPLSSLDRFRLHQA